jgi:hypothetical protein
MHVTDAAVHLAVLQGKALARGLWQQRLVNDSLMSYGGTKVVFPAGARKSPCAARTCAHSGRIAPQRAALHNLGAHSLASRYRTGDKIAEGPPAHKQ